ncbi:MAG: NFACT RNA binding domain-containing protein [Planctomycetota bacterium]|nr:NFACT RNA binding domain-containing protein [Planctomycetota bacterium]
MPAPAGSAARGLTAAELAHALAELRALEGATLLDAVALIGTGGHDDLLLVLQPDDPISEKAFVHVALGGARARVCTTARRFGRDQRARGAGPDLLQRQLQHSKLTSIEHAGAQERSCTLSFEADGEARSLIIELFGARGLWALCDGEGACVAMSRAVETAVRTLRRGDRYAPPPPNPARGDAAPPPPRFRAPVLAAIDEHFTALDLEKEQRQDELRLTLAAQRGRKKAHHKAQGLRRQLDDVARADELRAQADMMLAYAYRVARGASSMLVPAADGEGEVSVPLDPKKPVPEQVNRLYDKARRLEDGRAVTEQRLAEADEDVRQLEAILLRLEAPAPEDLDAARRALIDLGLLPKPQRKPKPGQRAQGVPYRRFTSAEGYPIFVGRNNNQNDELTMRFANGNDLWLHVGGGRPGSHVVVRLPKNKTASLETLLDAATLAVHFSKARGELRIDVIYTFRKNVRKPKGLPAGAVVPSQTKTVTVHADEGRLRRLLDSASTLG